MAVNSSNNKTKKKNSNNKKKDTSLNEEKDLVNDEEVTKEEDISLDIVNEKELKDNDKSINKKKLVLLLGIVLLFIIFTVYLMFPKIILNGNKEIVINYNEEYIEPGYKGYFLLKDISKNIKIDNKVDNSKIGDYYIYYYLNFGKIKINNKRHVLVVDNVKPDINIPNDEIKICPNQEIKDLEYKAIDEYDGDITDKVISSYLDDKVILSVSDNSNNNITKEIKISRIDDQTPVITLSGYINTYINYGNSYYEEGYSAIDNCDGDISDKVEINSNVDTSKIGTYKIIYSVSDSSGNKEEVIRNVIVRNNNLYNSGSIGNGVIYLTFDDGPNYGTTDIILDILKEQGIKATFFVTCNGPDELIKRIYNEGHTVALHTATHNYAYIYSSIDNYFEDLNRVSNRVKNITGMDSKIIRFPGGSSNTISRNYQVGIMSTLTSMVLDKGYRYFDWNIDAMDASTARSSSDVYHNVINNLSKSRSNVVLMHDTKGITRDALRNIINYAYSHNYTFNKIDMDTYMIRHSVKN